MEALNGTKGTNSRCWWHQSLFLFHFTSELTVADRRQKREIRQLEQELHKWQVLVDSITGEGTECSRLGDRVLHGTVVPGSPALTQSLLLC